MIKIGPNDLKNIHLPSTIDGARLNELNLPKGTNIGKLLTDINAAMTLARANVMGNPLIQSLCATTTERFVEYQMGRKGGFVEHTEFGEPDETRGDTGGHMLAIRKFDLALGWSKDYLEEARQIKLDGDVAGAVSDYEDLIWQNALTRLFSKDSLTGKRYGIGNGKSLPFADGGASGEIYVPPSVASRGYIGADSHDHYLRLSGKTQANVEAAVTHLWEHGYDGPFDMLIPEADVAEWTNKENVTGYRPRADSLVTAGANESLATVDDAFLGVITTMHGTVRLRSNARIETGFWNVHKTFGADDTRNPLWYCYDPMHGDGPYLEVPVPRSMPIEGSIIKVRGDFNVGESRTNSVNVMDAANGAYRSPVIS